MLTITISKKSAKSAERHGRETGGVIAREAEAAALNAEPR